MSTITISGFYRKDHERLDGLLKCYQQLKRIDFVKAKEHFMEFKLGLERHIIWEEDILFPLFNEKTEMQSKGATTVLCREHELILKYLDAIHKRIISGSPETDADEQLLLNTLQLHNRKEENIFYPALDDLLTHAEQEAVFATMEKSPSNWIRL